MAIAENQAVGNDLLRHREHLKERIERAHQEAVEAAFANVLGDADDGKEERVVQLVPGHPERVQKEHFPKVPAVHRRKLAHRHVERAQRDAVIDDGEDEPQDEVRAVLEQSSGD